MLVLSKTFDLSVSSTSGGVTMEAGVTKVIIHWKYMPTSPSSFSISATATVEIPVKNNVILPYALDASGGCNHKLKSEGYFDANFVVYTVFIMVAKSRIFHDTIFVINEVVIMTALSFRVLSTVDKVVMDALVGLIVHKTPRFLWCRLYRRRSRHHDNLRV